MNKLLIFSLVMVIGVISVITFFDIQTPSKKSDNLTIQSSEVNPMRKVKEVQNSNIGTMWTDAYTDKKCSMYSSDLKRCVTYNDILGQMHISAVHFKTIQTHYLGIVKEFSFGDTTSHVIFESGEAFDIPNSALIGLGKSIEIIKTVTNADKCKVYSVTSMDGNRTIPINYTINNGLDAMVLGLGIDDRIPLEQRPWANVNDNEVTSIDFVGGNRVDMGNCTESIQYSVQEITN